MRILVFLAALFWCVPAYCQQFTGITVTPSDPVFGELVNFSAAGMDYGNVSSYKWEWKYTGGACQPSWQVHSNSMPTVQHFENKPGTFKIRLTIKFFPIWYPSIQPPDQVFTKDILVKPPDRVVITGGLNAPVPPAEWAGAHVKFQLWAGNKVCGPHTAGVIPQERITNSQTFPPLLPLAFQPDSPWVPMPPQQPVWGMWWMEGNTINDIKRAMFSPEEYAQADIGNVFHRYKQELRIMYQDPCGDWQIIPLNSYWFESYKSSETTWGVREQ